MSALPYFPFYPNAWLDDTRIFDMGLEAEGAYIRLLALMWIRGGSIPDNERWICNALRCTRAKWKGLRRALIDGEAAVLFVENGAISNPRLTEELEKSVQKSIKNRSNIEQRWKKTDDFGGKKVNKINETVDTDVLPPLYHRDIDIDIDRDIDKEDQSPEPEPAPAAKPKSGRVRAVVQRPDGVSEQVWTDFLAVRRAKKAFMTDTALAGIVREAGKAGLTLQAALEICCQRGWAGFKAEWAQNLAQSATKKAQTPAQAAPANISQYANIPGFE